MADYSEMDVRALWRAYKKLGSAKARNRLIEFYLPLADQMATRIVRRMPPQVTFDEIKSDATIGLIDAIERFDPWRGVKFQSFAARRINGQVIDEMRTRDWTPRTVLSRTKTIKEGIDGFRKAYGRAPRYNELRRYLDLDRQAFEKIFRDAAGVTVSSLSNCAFVTELGEPVEHNITDRSSPDPAALAEASDLRERVTRSLSRTERLLIVLYFWEGLTMKEAGTAVGLSESRVSQVLSSILARLRISITLREIKTWI